MAIIRFLRKIVLKKPNKYCIIDLCAGNALTSIVASFLLPINSAIAVDINKRSRSYNLVNKFSYLKRDIFDQPDYIPELPCIIISSHPCRNLAKRITEIYNEFNNCHYLFLMPCCTGQIQMKIPSIIKQKLGKYLTWSYYLTTTIFDGKLYQDKNILSPCNVILKTNKINDKRI